MTGDGITGAAALGEAATGEAVSGSRLRLLAALGATLLLTGAATGYAVVTTGGDRTEAARAASPGPALYRVESGRVLVAPLTGTSVAKATGAGKAAVAGKATGASTATGVVTETGVVTATGLRCARFAAGGATRVCLTAGTGVLDHGSAVILDENLRERSRIPLAGVPSRARVSASGRMIAWTVFVRGDSYSGAAFSTWTSILDTVTGEYVANMETLGLLHDGGRYHSPDVNYWGVTFATGDDRFYATVATRGRTYLVEASMQEWEGRTLRADVECPSLSPDGRRVAFKQRVGVGHWRLAVLDLASSRTLRLAERADVDDQALWLDDSTVAYARRDGSGIWAVPADGTGVPRRIAPTGTSPAVTTGQIALRR